MRLRGLISLPWRSVRASRSDYIELDRTPTGKEEQAGFEDPSKLFVRLHNHNYHQDIQLRRKFADFSLRSVRVWVIFLIAATVFQGTGGGFSATLWGTTLSFPKFHLEQWAFVGLCGTTSTSVLGLAHLVGKYLFGGVTTKIPDGSSSADDATSEQSD